MYQCLKCKSVRWQDIQQPTPNSSIDQLKCKPTFSFVPNVTTSSICPAFAAQLRFKAICMHIDCIIREPMVVFI